MVYPWLFEDFAELRRLREAAEVVAGCSQWGALYDPERLSRNTFSGVGGGLVAGGGGGCWGGATYFAVGGAGMRRGGVGGLSAGLTYCR
jgi:hypothetical protein